MLQLGVWQVMPAVERHTVTGQTVPVLPFLMDEGRCTTLDQSYTKIWANLQRIAFWPRLFVVFSSF